MDEDLCALQVEALKQPSANPVQPKSSSPLSACSICSGDIEMPLAGRSAVKAQEDHAAAPKNGGDTFGSSAGIANSVCGGPCNERASTRGGPSKSSGGNKASVIKRASHFPEADTPFYMRVPLLKAVANWFDQMWYAESVFVRYGEGGGTGGTCKRSDRTKVVVDRASAATQGSFLSAGAASDNVEISELKRKQRESIQLLPLRFKDKQAEEEFVFNSRRLMEMRSIGLFVVKVLATTCVYGVLAVSGILQISAYVPDVLNQGLHATYAALMVLAVVSVLLPVVPWIKSRLEYSLYAIFFTETIVLALFVTTQKMSAYTDKTWELNFKSRQTEPSITSTSEDLCAESPLLTVHILAVELIMDAWVQFFMYFFIITVSIVLPSRVRVAAWVQVIVLLIYCIPVFTGQVYCRILLYPELLRMLHAFIILGSAIAGAYASESKRRGLFYSWLTMKHQMKRLESERDKKSDDNLSSGISALQKHCKQVEVALMSAKTAPGGTDISSRVYDAVSNIEACLEIMANSKDLYHTELHEDLRDKTFIKALNVQNAAGKGLLSAGARSGSHADPPPPAEKVAEQAPDRTEGSVEGNRFPCFVVDLASRVGVDLTFNPLVFHRSVQAKDSNNSAFFECGYSLLWRHAADWGCDDRVLRAFLIEIEGLYNDLPYHNAIHGAMVAHLIGVFCRLTRLNTQMNSLGAAAVIVAALCHDVGHPGRNNAFFSAGRSPLAVLYNDRSVLENFHSALTFVVLSHSSCNIFAALSKPEVIEIRSHMISLILATDMKTHFSALSRFRAGRQNPSFDHKKQREDTWLVVEMCMRAADIGHSIVPWEQHFEWSSRVTAEFYLQGDEESRLGRGVSPLCDRDLHSSMARNQVGFLAHIVKPLFTELNSLESVKGAFQQAVDSIEANANRWQQLQDSGIDVTFSSVVIACEEALKGKDHVLDINLLTDSSCRCACCKAGNEACQRVSMRVRINENVVEQPSSEP